MMVGAAVAQPGRWDLPPGLEAAAAARRLTRAWLAGWASDIDSAAADNLILAVSELTANATVHGAPPVVLSLHADERANVTIVTAVVHDAGSGLPRVREAASLDLFGRGLAIVDAISDRLGVWIFADGGKDVWCEVAIPVARHR